MENRILRLQKMTMNRTNNLILCLLVALVGLSGCRNDDNNGGPEAIPARDRGEESLAAQTEIEEFLQTHFYNYEEFENPPADFDFNIVFDTIAGDNSDKIPLIQQVSSKTVTDREESDVEYTLYYLDAITGGGEDLQYPDIASIAFEGRLLDLELFDSSVIPLQIDLTGVINGFQDALIEFNGATQIISNPDGTVSFENFGVGAVFIPSGLGYFLEPPPQSIIPVYAQLLFTFKVYDVQKGDQDGDGIPSIFEDLNGNGFEEDDDTDEDGVPDFADFDDDGDGIPTRDEIEIDDEGNVTFPDADGDGIPDYRDDDN